jgi:hypothetical protein
MVATISPEPRLQFFASDGSFLVGGKLYTYAAGTTTPLVAYTTSTGLIANTNPIILDSRGEASVWLGSSKYKFVLKDANDVEIWTQDNLQGYANADGSNAYGTWPISITGNAATATALVGGAVTSINGAGLYGFTLTGGPITSTGTLTVTPPVPSTVGNYMVSNGTSWVSQAFAGGSQFQDQLFTASGTWTAPTGVTKVRATVIGGGSGSYSGFSGSPGGIAVGTYTVSAGTAYTITVGAGGANSADGGTSSFASFCSATGGAATGAGSGSGGGIGSGGTLGNSAWDSVSTKALAPSGLFFTPWSGASPVKSNGSSAAQAYTAVYSASSGAMTAGAPGTSNLGGMGGIVYLEWVG